MPVEKSRAERQLEFFDSPAPRWGGPMIAIAAFVLPLVFKAAGIGWLPAIFIGLIALVPSMAEFMRRGIQQEHVEEPAVERLARYWSCLFWSTLILLGMFYLALLGIVFGWR